MCRAAHTSVSYLAQDISGAEVEKFALEGKQELREKTVRTFFGGIEAF